MFGPHSEWLVNALMGSAANEDGALCTHSFQEERSGRCTISPRIGIGGYPEDTATRAPQHCNRDVFNIPKSASKQERSLSHRWDVSVLCANWIFANKRYKVEAL